MAAAIDNDKRVMDRHRKTIYCRPSMCRRIIRSDEERPKPSLAEGRSFFVNMKEEIHMEFEKAHQLLLDRHLSIRSGERRGRLSRGHQYAEKLMLRNVWWPLFGNLDDLHPEYEIYDWNRKSQFLDVAFLPSYGKFGLECDGYQSHVKDMDREKFSYSLNRDTFLSGMGWRIIHFSFDDVQNRPEICRMLLQMQ